MRSIRALTCAFVLAAYRVVALAPEVQPWGANSFRLRWPSPNYTLDDELPFSPFLDAPLSSSAYSEDTETGVFTNGNLQITLSSDGLFTATRLSDRKVLYAQRALSYAAPPMPGIPPSAQITLDGPAQEETLVGMGEQGLTGRVTLQFPFVRVFQETEFYPYNQGRQAFIPLYFSSAGTGHCLQCPRMVQFRSITDPTTSSSIVPVYAFSIYGSRARRIRLCTLPMCRTPFLYFFNRLVTHDSCLAESQAPDPPPPLSPRAHTHTHTHPRSMRMLWATRL